ncbi:MAG: ABC transporter substrate-binding protein [Candidatus Methylomirabilia bacterium]
MPSARRCDFRHAPSDAIGGSGQIAGEWTKPYVQSYKGMMAGDGFISLAAALVVVVLAPVPASAQFRGELRVGVSEIPATLDPATALEGPIPLIAGHIFETLVRYREGGSDIEPNLATHWSVSRDGLTWRFTLRSGVRFHDGTLLTAPLVVASFERQLVRGPLYPDPNLTWPALLRGLPGVVEGVRAPDTRTVQIRLALPYAPLLTVLAHPGFSVIHTATSDDGTIRWLGTGPYRLSEISPDQIVLDTYAGYWGAVPRMERIVFVAVESDDQAEAELARKQLDLWIPSRPPRRTDGALSLPGWQVGLLAIQTEREPLARKKVRQAIAAALDPSLIALAVDPVAIPLRFMLPPGVWGDHQGSPIMTSNPQAARALLAEAGLSEGVAPTLHIREGSGMINEARIAEAMRLALAQTGITLQIRSELPETVDHLARFGNHELVLTEAQVAGGDPHLLLYPLSTTEGASRGPMAKNLSFYRNSQLDDLLIRASQLGFRRERLRLYRRAQALLAEELPWIPLYVRLHWVVVRPGVRNFRLHPSGIHRLDRVWLERSRPRRRFLW